MIKYREILRLLAQDVSKRGIAASCGCSRNTITDVLERAESLGIVWPIPETIGDVELQRMMFPEKHMSDERRLPEMDYVHKEMAKSGVTLSLLWHEYVLQCRNQNEIPYSYRQFCRYYHQFAVASKATMRIKRKPGEVLEVDWAGTPMIVRDRETGENQKVYVFVASLPCSYYSYVEAFPSMESEHWITAHIHAFEFIGGVTRMVVPDNLKTGVDKPSTTEPVINRSYQELAEHYQTIIMPARVSHPKDKPTVEGAVGIISTWIIASLRNQLFFTINELNQAIREKLLEFNTKDFQKKKGSRFTAFMEEEKFALLALPASPYEMASWKKATVQYDYHISIEKMYYSVPYEYIKHQVEVRITRTIVEIFFKSFRIASHRRLYGKEGQTLTVTEHMPLKHQQFLSYTAEHFITWAESVGPYTLITIKNTLESRPNEKQSLKVCAAISKLAIQYSEKHLEDACEKSLDYSPRVNLNSLKTILKTDQEQVGKKVQKKVKTTLSNTHGFVRGADYYGRKEK